MTGGVPFVGDTGTRVKLDCGEDISTATVMRVKYEKPDGTDGYWTAALDLSDADTETIYYDTLAADFDQSGRWRLQSYIEMPGWAGHGEIVYLRVYDPIS